MSLSKADYSIPKRTLLLNSSYEVLQFVGYKKAVKLISKDKCEIIANWQDDITWSSGSLKHPAILRLKNTVRRNYFNSNFSRKAMVKGIIALVNIAASNYLRLALRSIILFRGLPEGLPVSSIVWWLVSPAMPRKIAEPLNKPA